MSSLIEISFRSCNFVYILDPIISACSLHSIQTNQSKNIKSPFRLSLSLSHFLFVITQSLNVIIIILNLNPIFNITTSSIYPPINHPTIKMYTSTVLISILSALASATPTPLSARACGDCLGPAGPPSLVVSILSPCSPSAPQLTSSRTQLSMSKSSQTSVSSSPRSRTSSQLNSTSLLLAIHQTLLRDVKRLRLS